MKLFKIILLSLLLCGPALQTTQAGVHVSGMGRAGSSSVMRGGFSSQKSIARPAPSGSNTTSFGSFGAAKSAPTGSSNSALSQDLNATGANANALKTYDARQQAQTPPAAGAPGYTPGYAPGYAPPAQPVYVQQPVIVQHSGFFSSPFWWFWVGNSMAHDRVVVVNNGGNGNGAAVPAAVGADAAVPGAPVQPQPQDDEHDSLLGTALKTVLWTVGVTAAICLAIRYFARRTARRTQHYSL